MRHINERGIEMVKSFEGLALTYVLLMCGLWVMALPVAALADLLIWIWNQLRKLKQKLFSFVTWKIPKDGFLGLLKRHLPKISIPLYFRLLSMYALAHSSAAP